MPLGLTPSRHRSPCEVRPRREAARGGGRAHWRRAARGEAFAAAQAAGRGPGPGAAGLGAGALGAGDLARCEVHGHHRPLQGGKRGDGARSKILGTSMWKRSFTKMLRVYISQIYIHILKCSVESRRGRLPRPRGLPDLSRGVASALASAHAGRHRDGDGTFCLLVAKTPHRKSPEVQAIIATVFNQAHPSSEPFI